MSSEIEKVKIEDPWEWMGQVTQKLTKARERVIEHKDIPESYMPLLKILYRAFYNDEYPIYENKMEGECQTVSQNNLFTDVTADYPIGYINGTKVDYSSSETNE